MINLRTLIFGFIIILFFLSNSSTLAATTYTSDIKQLDEIIKIMPLETKISQMFMYTFPGTKISNEYKRLVSKYPPIGGLVLYSSNIESTAQLVTLTDNLQKSAGNLPLFISMDQEGGSVKRLPIGTFMPGNMALGAANSKQSTYNVGNAIGEELFSLGINVNLAPVLDLISDINNQEIGIRSFGSDPNLVSNLGIEYIKGLQASGVVATAKHFPGHGGTALDSHLFLPVIAKDKERLKNFEIKPFQKAIASGVDMIMPAHLAYPALDNTSAFSKLAGVTFYLPATLSYKILTELLRKKMGFNGIIISDSLQMKAISNYYIQEEAVVIAVNAGVDILLIQNGFETSYSRLLNAVMSGEVSLTRINESIKRIISLKLKKGLIKVVNNQIVSNYNTLQSVDSKIKNAKKIINNLEHKNIEKIASNEAVTILKSNKVPVTLSIEKMKTISLFATSENVLSYLQSSILKIVNNKTNTIKFHSFNYEGQNDLNSSQKNLIDSSDISIMCSKLGTSDIRDKNRESRTLFPLVINNYALLNKKLIINISTGLPIEPIVFPKINNIYAVYGFNKCNIEAGINTIFSLKNAKGKLPINLY